MKNLISTSLALTVALILSLGLMSCDESPMTADPGTDGATIAKKPGGGGGPGGGNGGGDGDPQPIGTVYFYDAEVQGNYATNPDGSGRTDVGIYGSPGAPSHELHGGERWFLVDRPATGTYPDGRPRYELFLEAASGASVQVTDEPNLEIISDGQRWIPGDAGVGFRARRISTGDCQTNPGYYEDGGIYTIDITFASGTPAPSGSANLLVPFAPDIYCEPAVGSPVWSPSADSLVYVDTQRVLTVKVLSTGATIPIATDAGGALSWSVRGEILYGVYGMTSVLRIRADDPNGEPVTLVEQNRGKGGTMSYAHWSPDGNHFAYRELVTGWILEASVYVTDRNGSGKTNLTRDLEFTTPMGWR